MKDLLQIVEEWVWPSHKVEYTGIPRPDEAYTRLVTTVDRDGKYSTRRQVAPHAGGPWNDR